MTILEMKEEVINLRTQMTELVNQTETRELNEEETSQMAEIRTKIDELEQQIADEEKRNAEIAKTEINNNHKEIRQMNLFNLVKGIANGNLSEDEKRFVNGNTISSAQYRAAIQATVATQGKENVPTDKMPLEVAIRNASVLDKLGCTWFGDAVGDIKLPKYSGSNVAWAESENAAAADGAGTFSEITLSPKRLTAYITISRQFLEQSPENAEGILINDLARSIAEKIDKTVFGVSAGTTAQPAGLFADTAYTESGEALSAITFDDILDVEAKVEGKNGSDFVFVCDPKMKYALRGTQMASGLQMVWNNGELDGRKAVVSNSVNPKSILCFDPRDLAAASWDYNLIVDPYSLAGNNQIKVTVNYLFDAKLKGDRIAAEIFS